ncbi:hypothetical protein DXT91_07810 [Agrobacterium tumefaciens]|uniref:hypothetical protein n=1 Tax=Agrobacterium tumefaciens TaxID=358 RepID=UPI0012B98A21|nr:hypothetical protein [Agrobacterium tumefaciens]MQB04046.1 hypothetical protein [Agrobacterium tumefaciens]
MLLTGNQLKAARALAGMDQPTLAARAGISKNTIVSLEKRGADVLTGRLDTVRALQVALEEAGVELLSEGGRIGVRLKA